VSCIYKEKDGGKGKVPICRVDACRLNFWRSFGLTVLDGMEEIPSSDSSHV
jgi:hypothetical protein